MIETIITICALTMVSPYYDCNSEWNIIIYDETTDKIPGSSSAIGSATWTKNMLSEKGQIELVHNYKDLKGKRDHLLKGGGVLWHEILHMKCKCNWHDHWDTLDEKGKSRNHVRIPTIPQSIVPFLKGDWR